MKNALNNMYCILIAHALKIEDGTICVAYEKIVVSECHGVYAFVVNTMFKMALKAKHKDVFISSSDGIMN